MMLSKRLQAVADLVPKCRVAADIGCDHAHVAIYLCQNHIADYVIACDVAKGPLLMAAGNIKANGMEDNIKLRLSDGLKALKYGEATVIVIAGMGGPLMVKIISEGFDKIADNTSLVLSPQSDIPSFRKFLYEKGLMIEAEDMVLEDDKYYTIIRAVKKSPDMVSNSPMNTIDFEYGKELLNNKNEVLKSFLLKENKQLTDILSNLKALEQSSRIDDRIAGIEKQLKLNKEALKIYEVQGNS